MSISIDNLDEYPEICKKCKGRLLTYDDYGVEYYYCADCGTAYDINTGKEIPEREADEGWDSTG